MKDTYDPQFIYDAFYRNGFTVRRIDQFDQGNYAEIRTELNYPDFLTLNELQEIILKLNVIEESENVKIKIVHVDMIHKSLRVNIYIES
jgi:hypothetical protein